MQQAKQRRQSAVPGTVYAGSTRGTPATGHETRTRTHRRARTITCTRARRFSARGCHQSREAMRRNSACVAAAATFVLLAGTVVGVSAPPPKQTLKPTTARMRLRNADALMASPSATAVDLEAACAQLIAQDLFEPARLLCRRAQELSGETWVRPFLTEASAVAALYAERPTDALRSLAVDRLRHAVSASPMDELTDFQTWPGGADQFRTVLSPDEQRGAMDLPGLDRRSRHPVHRLPAAVALEEALPAVLAELRDMKARVAKAQRASKAKLGNTKQRKKQRQRQQQKNTSRKLGWLPVGGYSERHDASLLAKGGAWENLGLFSYGVRQRRNCKFLFPSLCALIEALPRVRSCSVGHVLLSRLRAGSQITAHRGSPGTRLTIQCPLELPDGGDGGARLVVDGPDGAPTTIEYEVGRCFVFDDNLPHRVEVDPGSGWRTVLLAHVWHPGVRSAEMLASVALTANMDPANRESVMKHVYAVGVEEWKSEALGLRAELRAARGLTPSTVSAPTTDL